MGFAQRFGLAVARTTTQDKCVGAVHIEAMGGRDVDRFGVVLCAEAKADAFALIGDRSLIAALVSDRRVISKEGGFAYADSGDIKAPSEMAGKPESTGMCDAVSIDQQRFGRVLEFGKGVQQQGGFAQGKQAAGVRIFGLSDPRDFFDDGVCEHVVEDDGSVSDIVVFAVSNIGSPDQSGLSRALGDLDLACTLNLNGFCRGGIMGKFLLSFDIHLASRVCVGTMRRFVAFFVAERQRRVGVTLAFGRDCCYKNEAI